MMLYKNTKAMVASLDRDTDFFDIVTEILQGDILSLFKCFALITIENFLERINLFQGIMLRLSLSACIYIYIYLYVCVCVCVCVCARTHLNILSGSITFKEFI